MTGIEDQYADWQVAAILHQVRVDDPSTAASGLDDNSDDHYRRWLDIEKQAGCHWCKPHRGENRRGDQDGKVFWDPRVQMLKFRPSKGKDRK